MFQTETGRLLVDCGMFQGPKTLKALNYAAFPFRPADIDVVLLTHAHIDHSGLLPKLIKDGFAGPIMATRGTIDLCTYLLPDAGSIQESEVVALNRRNGPRGRAEVSPIYTKVDAIASLDAFRPVEYETWFEAMPGVRARYWNAGHLLGSASIEIEFDSEGAAGKPLRVLASGDIGPDAKLLQPDPEAPAGFDYVISESTYGHLDRPATTPETRRQRLAVEVREAHAANGPLIIPAFAVERTQELIVDLVDLMERREVPDAPIFLDSPLAIRATEVFRRHSSSFNSGVDVNRLLNSSRLRCTETVDESKAIAKLNGFHVIIAASGMCDAGRIRHHLKRWLWHKNATVLLVGFQAQGTLGRFLFDRVKKVRIQGEEIKVAARIRYIDDYSGHADGPELARWIAGRHPIHRGLFLVHGEEPALAGLFNRVVERIVPAAKVFTPILDDVYELSTPAPTPVDASHRRRLAPEAVVALDWHNDMSKLILDINDRIEAAADDRARGVIIRKLRRALDIQD
jgi:metallo-beta-lactamase family protein